MCEIRASMYEHINWWRLLTGWPSLLPFLFFFCLTVKRSRTRENNTTPEGYQPWRVTDRDRRDEGSLVFSIKRNFLPLFFFFFFFSTISHTVSVCNMCLLFPWFLFFFNCVSYSLSSCVECFSLSLSLSVYLSVSLLSVWACSCACLPVSCSICPRGLRILATRTQYFKVDVLSLDWNVSWRGSWFIRG